MVFLDESGVNINMSRIYGRAKSDQRVNDGIPLNTPANTTILSSVRLDGSSAFTTYIGGTKGTTFVEYLRNNLIPTLHKGDIVIMDNLRSHHVKEVCETLEAAGMIPLYLPPYSPDFNPIEKLWSKLKAILRKLKVRTIEQLPDAIQYAFSCISKQDCIGWFQSCGIS